MRYLLLLLTALLLTTCLDPVAPAFQLEDPFYLVEGRIDAGRGNGEIRIRESAFTEATKRFNDVEGAVVTSLEADGTVIDWEAVPDAPGTYRLPVDFAVRPGDTWHLAVTLPDGTAIESAPETVPAPVSATALAIVFEQNSFYDPGSDSFIPRFEFFLDYDDPAGTANYYTYDYRYWEEVIICATCPRGRYRNGECIEDRSVMPRYDYYCDTEECFRITEGTDVIYGDDELTDGQSVTGFPIGGIPFEAFGGLLVEGSLRSVTRAGYDYGKVVQDLTTGNAGLNATTPAALDGNVRNLDPAGRTVLGYVGSSAVTTVRAYIERDENTGTPLLFDDRIYPEPTVGVFVPPLAPCEVPGRTSVRPDGWGE